MTEISAADLKPGDWLLFQGDPDSWLSKAIMMMTDSDVSHAALYIGDGKVAEEISAGLVATDVEKRLGRSSYVMRRREPHPDLEPVLGTAHAYLEEGQKYAFSNLVLLGLILMYKKVTVNSLRRRIIVKILKAATVEVIGLIEKFGYEGKTPMVCSQFVYECYARPSAENEAYRLELEDPLLEAPVFEDALVDELKRYPAPTSAGLESIAAEEEPVGDPEELARQLIESFEQEEAGLESVGETAVDDELYQAAAAFAAQAEPLLAGAPRSEDTTVLEAMADQKSYFVAPSDLLRVHNGRRVGVIPPQPPPEQPPA